jgi:hypothetical protein
MNTQDTNNLQNELNDSIKLEQAQPAQESQSVEIHVEGFTLFAETMK